MSCQRVDPPVSEALCGYNSFHEYAITMFQFLQVFLKILQIIEQRFCIKVQFETEQFNQPFFSFSDTSAQHSFIVLL